MNYSDVRAQIRTGDLIAFRKRHGLLATLTRWITMHSGWKPRWPMPAIPAPDDVVSALGVPPVLQFRPVDPWGGRND